MIVFQIVTICSLSLPSRSSQCPRIGILAEYETSMFLHKVPQYLSLIFRKVLQCLRHLFLLINNIGPKVVLFSPVIFSIIYNMNNYHAATFSLTSNTLTSFNVNSKCLDEKIAQTNQVIKPNQFSGQLWKMEGTQLVNKAGMFYSNDTWNLIPLIQEKSKSLNITCK